MMNELHAVLRSVFERLQEHDRRLAGSQMRGKVKEVDAAKGLVRIVIGKDSDGKEVKSPWVPYKQTSGALKMHSAPSVGQTMTIQAETGDIQQGIAEPFHWNDDNKAPSDKQSDHVLTFGDVKVTLVSGGLSVDIGGTTFELTSGGFEQTGGAIKHNGTAIDDTHIHTGVTPGGGLSGVPE